jgi:thiosulfate/3-mercaptopyruvate sulfurtransferase
VLDASMGAFRGHVSSIPGARPFDIDGQLSDSSVELPHTMPAPETVVSILRDLGLHDCDHVVVYDAEGVYSSPRALWMLRAVGHLRSSVLDGGLPAWTAAGGHVSSYPAGYEGPVGDLQARQNPNVFVARDEVADALAHGDRAVMDARSAGRFGGVEPEPREGLRLGHMPGAVNVPYASLLADGRFLKPDQLRAVLAAATPNRRLITSCGSGVTACIVAVAALLAGYDDVAVYDGSWSEWGRPDGGAVAAGPGH